MKCLFKAATDLFSFNFIVVNTGKWSESMLKLCELSTDEPAYHKMVTYWSISFQEMPSMKN